MTSYVALLRGINVGGKNLISMRDLSGAFRDLGYANVRTHGQSGNVLFETNHAEGRTLEDEIEEHLHARFEASIMVVIRSHDELLVTVASAPEDHGSEQLRSDVFFLKHPLTAEVASAELPELRKGVDSIAIGPGVLYFSRTAAQATRTRIQRVFGMPMFQQMTVRTWRVTTRLFELLSPSENQSSPSDLAR